MPWKNLIVMLFISNLIILIFNLPAKCKAQTLNLSFEKQIEGCITSIGNDYIVVDGKKYLVSKSLKIRDKKGKYTNWGLRELQFVNRVLITLEDNVVVEVQILSFQS